jgi:hypothetical protein
MGEVWSGERVEMKRVLPSGRGRQGERGRRFFFFGLVGKGKRGRGIWIIGNERDEGCRGRGKGEECWERRVGG